MHGLFRQDPPSPSPEEALEMLKSEVRLALELRYLVVAMLNYKIMQTPLPFDRDDMVETIKDLAAGPRFMNIQIDDFLAEEYRDRARPSTVSNVDLSEIPNTELAHSTKEFAFNADGTSRRRRPTYS